MTTTRLSGDSKPDLPTTGCPKSRAARFDFPLGFPFRGHSWVSDAKKTLFSSPTRGCPDVLSGQPRVSKRTKLLVEPACGPQGKPGRVCWGWPAAAGAQNECGNVLYPLHPFHLWSKMPNVGDLLARRTIRARQHIKTAWTLAGTVADQIIHPIPRFETALEHLAGERAPGAGQFEISSLQL